MSADPIVIDEQDDCPDCPDPIAEHSDEGCLHGWRYYIDDNTHPSMVDSVEGCPCERRGPLRLVDVPTEDLRS